MKKNRLTKDKINVFFIGVFVISVIIVAFILFCGVYGILTSLKGYIEYIENPIGLPRKFDFKNFETVFKSFVFNLGPRKPTYNVIGMAYFTVIYCAVSILPNLIVTTMVAYVTARFKKRFSEFLVVMVTILMSYSVVGSQVSELKILMSINLFDTFLGIALLKANFLNMYFLVLYATFKGFSGAYAEAAKIDGASNLKVFIKIMVPLASPTIFAIGLLMLIGCWNDYQTPMVYIPSHPTISMGLFKFLENTANDTLGPTIDIGACMVVFVPMLIIFIIFQKKLVGGISIGGVKE